MRTDKSRREERNYSENLKRFAFPGRDMAVTCKKILLREFVFDRETVGLLVKKTSFEKASCD